MRVYVKEYLLLSIDFNRSPLLYYDIIYMMTPSYWKYRRACQIVHEVSMDVIKKRRAILKEKKVLLQVNIGLDTEAKRLKYKRHFINPIAAYG